MKRFFSYTLIVMALAGLSIVSFAQDKDLKSTEGAQEPDSMAVEDRQSTEVIFATYFHGTRRCVTCRKLEAYSEEALREGFQEELNDSILIWRTINYDEKENEHYLKDYGLYTKALILSRVKDGTETEWINLSEIWDLVGDKDKYLKYVREETSAFINEDAD